MNRFWTVFLFVCLLSPCLAIGQEDRQRSTPIRVSPYESRQLAEVDRLLLLENLSRARTLLLELEKSSIPRRDLLPRYIELAQQTGDHQEAVDLCEEALTDQPLNPRLLRKLAVSNMALDNPAAAAQALNQFVQASPDRQSTVLVAVELWQTHGYPEQALAMCDSARRELDDPRFLARPRAACLLELGRFTDGVDELIAELRDNELNLPLIRIELLERILREDMAETVIARLRERADEADAGPGELVLAASLALLWEGGPEAVALVEPLLREGLDDSLLLRLSATLTLEVPLLPNRQQQHAVTYFLLTVLEDMADRLAPSSELRPHVLDVLAEVCENSLAAGLHGTDPAGDIRRLERILELVKVGNPGSPRFYSAQIHLANFTRDVLGQPAAAAARLERLLTDLDLPLAGVALARLTLGECYLAAGDTMRGRIVLTRLGRSGRFRAAAGHAHYHLARLDLAEGHWAMARDRFATVAMDNPQAAYANDALDFGLAIAEELDNPTGGPALLSQFARHIFFELTAQPDSQLAALERYVSQAASQVDLSQPQYLLEKGRFELAALYENIDRRDLAVDQYERIVLDHPDGRYPAEALFQTGRLHELAEAWELAREAYERLLIQYPNHLFADDVRDRIRSLP
ncbi:MAG: tetratricopeptide repeat protein [bacterium]